MLLVRPTMVDLVDDLAPSALNMLPDRASKELRVALAAWFSDAPTDILGSDWCEP